MKLAGKSTSFGLRSSMPLLITAVAAIVLTGCEMVPSQPIPPDQQQLSVGRDLFFNGTFNGNGRTCGSCHGADNNFTINRNSIARLADDDPLFVAERVPALNFEQNGGLRFENPLLMREHGVIVENQDGFGDLANNFNLRGVPHTFGLRTSLLFTGRDGVPVERTGWSADGAPGDGSLRSFATGAVTQHFPLTTNRVDGEDFRLPNDVELDAMEAFQLSLGRQEEVALPLAMKDPIAQRGQETFNDLGPNGGKCLACHFNAGANLAPFVAAALGSSGNANFNTGVEDQRDRPQTLRGEVVPSDDGLGTPGDGTFNTPTLVEAADTAPFFHDNSVSTLEGAVAFYNSDAFANSPAGQIIAGAAGSPISLDQTQVDNVARFLRVINVVFSNIDPAVAALNDAVDFDDRLKVHKAFLIGQGVSGARDAALVLQEGGLHSGAIPHLLLAQSYAQRALLSHNRGYIGARDRRIGKAKEAFARAREFMIDKSS
jgi:mono/diheme cytochrome c family protein